MSIKKENIISTLLILLIFINLIPIKSLFAALDPIMTYSHLDSNIVPIDLKDVSGTLFFSVSSYIDGVQQTELWKYDKVQKKAVLVKDIGSFFSSNPSNFTEYQGGLYFTADDGINGVELWKSDGTESGTVMVKDINLSAGSNPSSFILSSGILYFVADDGINGQELWKSDGTEQGTLMLKDINPGNIGSYPYNFTYQNGVLYFLVYNGVNGTELWKSDGTEQGTEFMQTITNSYANVSSFVTVNGNLFFKASTEGDHLYAIIDGNFQQPNLNENFYQIDKLVNLNENLYFFADNSFWVFDNDAQIVKYNLNIQSEFFKIGNTSYFSADDGEHGTELWKSDGTEQGTVMVKDIYPGSDEWGNIYSSSPTDLMSFNGVLYFVATNKDNGTELWKSDGTEQGTVIFKDFFTDFSIDGYSNSSLPYNLRISNNNLFFLLSNVGGIWKIDDKNNLTKIKLNVEISQYSTRVFDKFISIDDTLYFFTGYNGGDGGSSNLWKSDLNGDNAQMLSTSIPDLPENLTNVNGVLYFSAYFGNQLWRSDGTDNGTYSIFSSPNWGDQINNLVNINGTLYFTAGGQLYNFIGTPNRVSLLEGFTNIDDLIDFNGVLCFLAGGGLWKYNSNLGIAETLTNNLQINEILKIGNSLYFSADDGVHGTELWKTDGTEEGTVMVKDIYSGSDEWGVNSSYPNGFINMNGTLFFTVNNGVTGLWKSDGTNQETILIKETDGSTSFGSFIGVGGKLYFTTNNWDTGIIQLWKTDGTESGTQLVISTDQENNTIGHLYTAGGILYSVTQDEDNTQNFYRFNNNSFEIIDINHPNIFSYLDRPVLNSFTDINGTLYFSSGREGWGPASIYNISKDRFLSYEFDKTGNLSNIQQSKQVDAGKSLIRVNAWDGGMSKYLETYHDLTGYNLKKFNKLEPSDYLTTETCENAGFSWLSSNKCEYNPSHFTDKSSCENIGYYWIVYKPDCDYWGGTHYTCSYNNMSVNCNN